MRLNDHEIRLHEYILCNRITPAINLVFLYFSDTPDVSRSFNFMLSYQQIVQNGLAAGWKYLWLNKKWMHRKI